MEKKKVAIAAVVSVIMLLTIFTSVLLINAVDSSSWYTTIPGVLNSDYYLLYPYAKKSVNVGFSKFGELIGIPASGNQSIQSQWIGLEYDGRDPFTPYDTVPMSSWINGWYIRIDYISPTAINKDRRLFAFAMFGDGSGWGGDWQYTAQPGGGDGGRQTNGSCTTDAMKILYNGPRRFIAQSVTHISDKEGSTTWPVLDLTITMIFDKDMKQVILLKDVKITIAKMNLYDKLDVQLSNREQYDLGPSPGYSSYAHYYEQEGVTCLGPDWHMEKNLTRDYEQHIVSYTGQRYFTLSPPGSAPLASGFLKIYDDNAFVNPSATPSPYTTNWANRSVYFTTPPAAGSDMKFVYKYVFKTDTAQRDGLSSWNHQYDIAQVISSDGAYVAWDGLWPPTSDFTVDGIINFLYPLSQTRIADMSYEPKQSPLIIGEWDFLMDHSTLPMFRGVEVKGVADRHDGNDVQYQGSNYLDREARYQLDTVFQAWDLLDAIEKQDYRWLYKGTIASHTNEVQLVSGLGDSLYYAVMSSEYQSFGVSTARWTRYFLKELDTDNGYPAESKWVNEFQNSSIYADTAYSKNWALYMVGGTSGGEMLKVTPTYLRNDTPPSTAPLTLQLKDLVDFGFWYKNISGSLGPHIEIKVYANPLGGETYNWANIAARVDNTKSASGWTHYTLNTIEDFIGVWSSDSAFQLTGQSGTGLSTGQFHSFEYWASKLGSYYVGSVGVQIQPNCVALVDDLSVAYLQRPSGIRYERVYNMEEDKLVPSAWDAYCTFTEKVTVDGALIARYGYQDYDPTRAGTGVHRPYYVVNFINGTLSFYQWSTPLARYITWDLYGSKVEIRYSTIEENDKGRYEWTIMGRDAFTSDSLGGALVTAAFKNKDIEIGLSGLDMLYYEWSMASIPYVMNCFGTAPGTRADYKDDGSTPGQRPALRSDWCTTWPITSSNMIGIGGPLANVFTSYLNEFTDAFYGTYVPGWGETYTPYATWQNSIVALTCWNGTKKGYVATYNTGYAVISTYKDLNGTVGLTIWGHGPRDTYYASKFFHEEIIYELQNFPGCVTSIVLKIDYTDPQHPTFTIPECLGTVSERLVETIKGGIHDP
jgi:hypothetical protein